MIGESVRVKDLIQSTEWRPGRSRDIAPGPAVSILLPTYRRGADGTLRRVIDRILGQSLSTLELIIVDDASTDGSAEIIEAAMARDGRVSCLRHPFNIGLPAVSEYEAYRRARGQFIGFAFDDFLFEHDAFETLVGFARKHPGAMVHGRISLVNALGEARVLDRHPAGYDRLVFENFIGNASVLLPREIIETVGLYDPHTGLCRVCDWDLWRRIQRKFPIRYADVAVGTECGVSRSDSLGNTYPMLHEAVQELSGYDRDQLLLPGNFSEREITEVPSGASPFLCAHLDLSRKFFADKPWCPERSNSDGQARSAENANVVVGLYGDASTIIACFNALRMQLGPNLTFIHPVGGGLTSYETAHLLRCDAVIFARQPHLPSYHQAVELCLSHHIDCYHLIDGACTRLDAGLAEGLPGGARPSASSPRKGVIVTSDDLHRASGMQVGGTRILELRAAFDDLTFNRMSRIRPRDEKSAVNIGYFEEPSRDPHFFDRVLPAIRKLAQQRRVAVFSCGRMPDHDESGISFLSLASDGSISDSLDAWARASIDIVVQPTRGADNRIGGAENVLLSSLYIGAVPILADDPAYAGIDETDGVLKSDSSTEGWRRALIRLADDATRAGLRGRFEHFCRSRFSAERNAAALQAIMRAAPSVDAAARELRWRASRSTRAHGHLARWTGTNAGGRGYLETICIPIVGEGGIICGARVRVRRDISLLRATLMVKGDPALVLRDVVVAVAEPWRDGTVALRWPQLERCNGADLILRLCYWTTAHAGSRSWLARLPFFSGFRHPALELVEILKGGTFPVECSARPARLVGQSLAVGIIKI